ncbi:Fic family protein [Xanthomonas fragariae]|uniref:Fic family protein n=1 Tax=Xanthomonas fragariae TaxID=48664 RepID=UPI003D18DD74
MLTLNTLEVAEADFAATAVESIEIGAPPFDLDYLRNLHRQLFDEVYDWAGCLRTVDIAKGATRFCIASRIKLEANQLFNQLNSTDLAALPHIGTDAPDRGALRRAQYDSPVPRRQRPHTAAFLRTLVTAQRAGSLLEARLRRTMDRSLHRSRFMCYRPLTHLFDTCVGEIEEL